ncbi:MAG TPA: YciI family protein [Candidatus Tectomicrobia bacterium]|nr:YciI family protein [Candidatus Tectomicrobia bacterium]
MKYTLPIDIGEQALHKTTPEECDAESVQLTHQLESRGAYLADSPPHPTSTTISGRGRKGKALVTDGPFAETREQLGG